MKLLPNGIELYGAGHWNFLSRISGNILGVDTLAFYIHKEMLFGYDETFYDCYHCHFSLTWFSVYCGGYPIWIKNK